MARQLRYQIALARLTEARTEQMLDVCRVIRPGAQDPTPVLDADGNVAVGEGATVYEGACTVSDPSSGRGPLTVTVEDASGVPHARVLKLPLDSPALRPGDLVTVTASPGSPGLVGDVLEVLGEDERSYATCRKYRARGSSWSPPPPG